MAELSKLQYKHITMTQMNFFTKQIQTHKHRNKLPVIRGNRKLWKDKLGVQDLQIQTAINEIDKRGPTV